MNKKILALLLSLMMTASFLSACGKETLKETETTETTLSTTEAPTELPSASAEPESFTFPADADAFAGSWTLKQNDMVMSFFFDGSGKGMFYSLGRTMKMAYEIHGDQIIMVLFYPETEESTTAVFYHEINEDKLTLTTEDGLTQTFTKDPQ